MDGIYKRSSRMGVNAFLPPLRGAVPGSLPEVPARGSRSGAAMQSARSTSARFARQYLEVQRLCFEFKVPKHHSESIALLWLIHSMEQASPPLSVTEAGIILNLPLATSARKIRELAAANLVEIRQDAVDKRRFHPSLTKDGLTFILMCMQIMSGDEPTDG